MLWLILGGFYLLLVTFFLGAFTLSRRADDQSRRAEEQLPKHDSTGTTKETDRIHRLDKLDRDAVDTVAAPLTGDDRFDKRLAG